MKDKIKKILKEEKDYYDSVYLIMSEDEKFIKYNLHVAGDLYFDGGPDKDGWESSDILDNRTFRNFYFNDTRATNGLISLMPQRILDRYHPKVVEYTMGFFRKRDSVSDVFDQLKESEEGNLDWAINDYSQYIKVGQKFKIKRSDVLAQVVKVSDDGKLIHILPSNLVGTNYPQRGYKFYTEKLLKWLISGEWVPVGNLQESEDDFNWVEKESNEPFHHILMKGNPRQPRLMDEIKRILFNPAVTIGDERFNRIAYWLEDHDYYPQELKLDGKTSYIEITKQRGSNNIRNGKWIVGPELSEDELYKLSQTNTQQGWNGNFWVEEFMDRFRISRTFRT